MMAGYLIEQVIFLRPESCVFPDYGLTVELCGGGGATT